MNVQEILVPLPREKPPWHQRNLVLPLLESIRRWRKRRPDVLVRRGIYRQEARKYVRRPPLNGVLERALATVSTGASRKDYMFLHRYVLARKPKAVLELGSGVTSLVIADALREVEKSEGFTGRLHTIENIPEYYEHAKSMCPPDLEKYVTYHCAPAKTFKWRGQLFAVGYDVEPEGPFDLIFVDGPNAPAGQASAMDGGAIDADALRALDRYPEHYTDIVIDGRFDTARTYSRFVRKGMAFRDNALNLSFFRRVRGRDLRRVPRVVPYQKDGSIFVELDV